MNRMLKPFLALTVALAPIGPASIFRRGRAVTRRRAIS